MKQFVIIFALVGILISLILTIIYPGLLELDLNYQQQVNHQLGMVPVKSKGGLLVFCGVIGGLIGILIYKIKHICN